MPRVVQLPTGPSPGPGPAPPNPCPIPGPSLQIGRRLSNDSPSTINSSPHYLYTQRKVSTRPIIAMQLQIIFTKTSAIYC